jgi:hypothetical protein
MKSPILIIFLLAWAFPLTAQIPDWVKSADNSGNRQIEYRPNGTIFAIRYYDIVPTKTTQYEVFPLEHLQLEIFYNTNGTVQIMNDYLHGRALIFDGKGILQKEKDHQNGIVRTYDDQGQLYSIKQSGIEKEAFFYPDGKLKQEKLVEDGQEWLLTYEYAEDGALLGILKENQNNRATDQQFILTKDQKMLARFDSKEAKTNQYIRIGETQMAYLSLENLQDFPLEVAITAGQWILVPVSQFQLNPHESVKIPYQIFSPEKQEVKSAITMHFPAQNTAATVVEHHIKGYHIQSGDFKPWDEMSRITLSDVGIHELEIGTRSEFRFFPYRVGMIEADCQAEPPHKWILPHDPKSPLPKPFLETGLYIMQIKPLRSSTYQYLLLDYKR